MQRLHPVKTIQQTKPLVPAFESVSPRPATPVVVTQEPQAVYPVASARIPTPEQITVAEVTETTEQSTQSTISNDQVLAAQLADVAKRLTQQEESSPTVTADQQLGASPATAAMEEVLAGARRNIHAAVLRVGTGSVSDTEDPAELTRQESGRGYYIGSAPESPSRES